VRTRLPGTRFLGLWLPPDDHDFGQVTDQTLIVRPELAIAQRVAELAASPGAEAEGGEVPVVDGAVAGDSSLPGGDTTALTQGAPKPAGDLKTRFFGTKQLSPDRYAADFKVVADEILAHLIASPSSEVKVTLEIEATSPQGFDEAKVRTVSENATTLKFEQGGFEES